MKPSTVRTGCAAVFVAMVATSILMASQKVAVPVPYIAAAIVAIMAAFVGATQDA